MTVEYTIRAYPTTYNGIRFRSRLEATWAAFFDQLGWRWEYEPFDLGAWSPDFLIFGKEANILVEVKPISSFDQDVSDKIDLAYPGDRGDLEYPDVPCGYREVLLLGIRPYLSDDEYTFRLGWLREWNNWDGAILGRWSESGNSENEKIGFCHEYQSYTDRISGWYDGNCGGDCILAPSEVEEWWAKAKNITQWRLR